MAIEQTRLVVGSTQRDGSTTVSAPPTTIYVDPVPPGQYFYSQETGTYVFRSAGYDGQLLAVDSDPTDGVVELYVCYNLTWRRATPYNAQIDSNTGQPHDPLASFYNPLAN